MIQISLIHIIMLPPRTLEVAKRGKPLNSGMQTGLMLIICLFQLDVLPGCSICLFHLDDTREDAVVVEEKLDFCTDETKGAEETALGLGINQCCETCWESCDNRKVLCHHRTQHYYALVCGCGYAHRFHDIVSKHVRLTCRLPSGANSRSLFKVDAHHSGEFVVFHALSHSPPSPPCCHGSATEPRKDLAW